MGTGLDWVGPAAAGGGTPAGPDPALLPVAGAAVASVMAKGLRIGQVPPKGFLRGLLTVTGPFYSGRLSVFGIHGEEGGDRQPSGANNTLLGNPIPR